MVVHRAGEAAEMWEFLAVFLNWILLFLSAFLILLILIQRGKGGGLIGALGGAGGSSPFGSRAGDQFTRWTIYIAIAWLLLTMFQVKAVQNHAVEMRQAGAAGAFRGQGGD
jgi:preprotein translocase subunit SecG